MKLPSNLGPREDISVNPDVKQERSEEIEQKWPHVQSMARKIESLNEKVESRKPLNIASIPRKSIKTTSQVSQSLRFFEKSAGEMKNYVVEEKESIIEEKASVVEVKKFPVSKRSSVEGKRSVGRGSSLPKNFTLALKEFEKSTDAKNKVLSEIFFNEEKVVPAEQEVELPPSEGTYMEQLTKLQEEGKTLQPAPLYRFLLRPEQEQFREDFLIGGPWMNFIKEDRSLAAKGEKPILVKEMEKLFEKGSPEQEELILKFAIRLIENGIFSKEVFQNGILNKKHMLELMDIPEVSGFNELINQFINAEAQLTRAADIEYKIAHPEEKALTNLLKSLSKWKVMGGKRDAISIKELAELLSKLSTNVFKKIHPSEFYGQAWTKKDKEEKAPNLTFAANAFNQISCFLVDQLLSINDPKERARLGSDLIKVAQRLIDKHHDYHSAMIIAGGVFNNAALEKVLDISERDRKRLDKLNLFFQDPGNSKELKAAYQNHEENNIPYTPFIGTFLTDFTFTDDKNPNPDQNNRINFVRMEKFITLHHRIEKIQERLSERKNLPYGTNEMIQATFDKEAREEAQWDRVSKIKQKEGS